MDWILLVKLALNYLKGTIHHTESQHKQKELISTVISELLKMHPDSDRIDAILVATEATGVKPNPGLFRTKSMRDNVIKSGKVQTNPRKAAPKKAKKSAKKKVAKS